MGIRGSRAVVSSLLLCGVATFAIARPARAADPASAPPAVSAGPADGFGLPGQVAIDASLQLGLIHSSGGSDGTTFAFEPGGDYFVAPNVSVGGLLGYRRVSQTFAVGLTSFDLTSTTLTVALRGGYNLRLGSQLSLWPKLLLGYQHIAVDVGTTNDSGYAIPLEVYVPLLIHVTPHLFIGIGPFFATQLKISVGDQSRTTQYGFQTLVGGYFGP